MTNIRKKVKKQRCAQLHIIKDFEIIRQHLPEAIQSFRKLPAGYENHLLPEYYSEYSDKSEKGLHANYLFCC
jgi:hypothetical protein